MKLSSNMSFLFYLFYQVKIWPETQEKLISSLFSFVRFISYIVDSLADLRDNEFCYFRTLVLYSVFVFSKANLLDSFELQT